MICNAQFKAQRLFANQLIRPRKRPGARDMQYVGVFADLRQEGFERRGELQYAFSRRVEYAMAAGFVHVDTINAAVGFDADG